MQSCADPQRLQQICDRLSADKIDRLLRKWLSRLPHPFTAEDRQAGYRYDLSILQAEFSLTQVLDRPVHGRLFCEQVIRENLDLGHPEEVQLMFNRRITRTTLGRFRTRILTQEVTPSLHVYYKSARIKQYHKEQRALCSKTTINNTYDFRIGKRLGNLPQLHAIGFAANRRLLEVERLSHVGKSTAPSPSTVSAPQAYALPTCAFTPCGTRSFSFGFSPTASRQRLPQRRSAPSSRRPLRPHPRSDRAGSNDLFLSTAPPAPPRQDRAHPPHSPLPRHRCRRRNRPLLHPNPQSPLRPALAAILPDHHAGTTILEQSFDNFDTRIDAWLAKANLGTQT